MTKIEWTDETWNPVTGCSRVSSGCDRCYAMLQARRFDGQGVGYDGTTRRVTRGDTEKTDWTGVVHTHEDRLGQPLRWRKPRRVFVCSMSDLFHPSVPFGFIDRVFATMALAKDHTFQILTKRPDRMREYLTRVDDSGYATPSRVAYAMVGMATCPDSFTMEGHDDDVGRYHCAWPLPNVWLGTSAENQTTADERIPELVQCPAAVRFLSAEPLLGPVDVSEHLGDLDWVIVGGESKHGARPMHPDWVRALRDQCEAAGVAFFFKQWGAYGPRGSHRNDKDTVLVAQDGEVRTEDDDVPNPPRRGKWSHRLGEFSHDEWKRREYGDKKTAACMVKRSKKKNGRTLDGRTHDAFPDTDA